MFAVTYPSRAIGLLTPGTRAAADASPSTTCSSSGRRPRGDRRGRGDGRRPTKPGTPASTSGSSGWRCWPASPITAWRRNLLFGLVVGRRHRRHRRATEPSGCATVPMVDRRARIGLDLDEEGRVEEGGHNDERGRRADIREHGTVDRRDGIGMVRVGHVHPRAHDIGQREAALDEGRLDDRERRPGLFGRVVRDVVTCRPDRRRSCRRRGTRRRRRAPGCSRSAPPMGHPR